MKKALVTSLLGLAAAVAVQAQGTVKFLNYGFTTLAPVTYGPTGNGPLNAGVNNTYTAGLYYQFGTVSWAGGLDDPAAAGWTLASASATFAAPNVGNTPGFFDGGNVVIPGYLPTTGPISFVVVAYNGASYATSLYRGSSVGFTLPSIATGLTPAGELGAGFQPFQVNLVPEPSSFALAGLGLAGLLIFRRRK